MADTSNQGKSVDLFTDVTKSNLTATEVAALKSPTTSFTKDTSKDKVVDTPLDNLIKQAKESNAKLTESFKDKSDLGSTESIVDSDTAARLKVVSARVMQILKDNGMDSQQCERAHKQLMEL